MRKKAIKNYSVKCTVKDYQNKQTFIVMVTPSMFNGFKIGTIPCEPIGGYYSNGFKTLEPLPLSWYQPL